MQQVMLRTEHLKTYFPVRRGLFQRVVAQVRAVDDVNLTVYRGETLGVVGESGCGKTTLGRTIVRLLEPTAGRVLFRTGERLRDLAQCTAQELRELRRSLRRPLRLQGLESRVDRMSWTSALSSRETPPDREDSLKAARPARSIPQAPCGCAVPGR